jgi:hypothetical protein
MMTKAIREAVDLLRDENLVWSYDIQNIKGDLAALLLVSAAQGDIMQTLADNLAKKICYFEDQETFINSYDLNLEKREDA